MQLWFYIWIITSIIVGIYFCYDYLKSPKYFMVRLWGKYHNKAVKLEDMEKVYIPAKNWKTHLMVIAQWLFATLVLGFILFIFFQEF